MLTPPQTRAAEWLRRVNELSKELQLTPIGELELSERYAGDPKLEIDQAEEDRTVVVARTSPSRARGPRQRSALSFPTRRNAPSTSASK